MPPLPDCQSASTHITQSGEQIIRLHDESSRPYHGLTADHPSRQVQMESAHGVYPGSIFEHSKVRAHARVEVEELVLAIPLVETVIDVHNAAVRDGFQQLLGLEADCFIRNRYTHRCEARKWRIRSQLSSSE